MCVQLVQFASGTLANMLSRGAAELEDEGAAATLPTLTLADPPTLILTLALALALALTLALALALTLPRCDALPTLVPRLDVIINNACQTVRRPPQYYLPLIAAEVGGAKPEDGPQVARATLRGRGSKP